MQGYAVSTTELRLKATHLARQSDNTTNFRGFISWSYAFLKRMVFLYDGKLTLHKGYHLTTRNNSLSSSHSLFNSERMCRNDTNVLAVNIKETRNVSPFFNSLSNRQRITNYCLRSVSSSLVKFTYQKSSQYLK